VWGQITTSKLLNELEYNLVKGPTLNVLINTYLIVVSFQPNTTSVLLEGQIELVHIMINGYI
jgi:hypothetical protein